MHGVFDARTHGAKGDNSSDDTAIIQDLIDIAADQRNGTGRPYGGVVQVPPGQYYVSGIRLRTQVTLMGFGPSTTIRLLPGVTTPLISLADQTVNHTNLRDLRLRGNKYGGGGGGTAHGIHYVNAEDTSLVSAQELYGFHGDGQHRILNVTVDAISGKGGLFWTRATIADYLHISDCTDDGIEILGSDNMFSHFQASWIGRRGVASRGGNNQLANGKVWYIGTDPAYDKADGYYIFGSRTRVVNCEAQDISRHALYLEGASDCQVSACMFDNIGNFKKTQNQGFDHPPIPAVKLFRYSDPRHAKSNRLSFSIGQRSAIPNLNSFVSFGTSVSNNQAVFSARPEFLVEGGVPVRRAPYDTTFDNVAIWNNGLA